MHRLLLLCLAALLFAHSAPAADGDVIPLWKHGPPGFEGRRNIPEQAHDYWVKSINNPSLTVFLPQGKPTGTAVVIVPGGGHRELVFNAEGIDPAKYFQQLGVAAFALKYRLALQPGSPYQIERDAAADVQRAIRLVRSRAPEWGIDPSRVGLMGWSAGGELAAIVTYGPNKGDPEAIDPVNRLSCRPDFQIVIYPGPRGLPDRLEEKPPPAFFLAAGDDVGPARTITRLLELYRVADVPAEVHIYAQGHHAFNMGNRSDLVSIKAWPQRLTEWMIDSGLLANRQSVH